MNRLNAEHATGMLPLAIIISFVIASALNVYPFSPNTATLRPMMMIMVLIFWLLFQPRYVGIFSAFTIGLLADFLMDTRLGQQAFAAVVVTLVIKIAALYIQPSNIVSAWFMASLGLSAFVLSLWLLQLITQNIVVTQSGLSLLTSTIIWPLVLLVLHRFTLSNTH
ncbi:rod shape-determining protein MreD [Psychrobacter urativorans]|uniref:rod shape-determining protein MreD n=1 Tax=Psychrobacter urativorans TaxID=45610 RepID=UPI001919FB7D|nr:rod shape-determining protein MreD [Psychrobacter urativorans]